MLSIPVFAGDTRWRPLRASVTTVGKLLALLALIAGGSVEPPPASGLKRRSPERGISAPRC